MTLGPQFEQLKLFMTPAEIKGYVNTSSDLRSDGSENMEQLWDRKVEESKRPRDYGPGSGVYDALSAGKPILGTVTVLHRSSGDSELEDKHHRVAAQADIDATTGKETFVPMEYKGDSGIPQPPKQPKWQRTIGPPKPMTTQEREQAEAITQYFL
jgi:hypothetical protein